MTTLALSGGGFRATLFHLGVIRYLHDVDLLRTVDLVCGVSGGAIIAAHLVHNWERYTGTGAEFDAAATKIVGLTQQDVRGHITRRLPWIGLMSLCPGIERSRTTALEQVLEEFFGPSLYLSSAAAPGRPDLHILATNLNTGGPWDFTTSGFYTEKLRPGGALDPFIGSTNLITTAFAVCASACFPAFFPPCKVEFEDLGIETPDREQYLSDGGIFDNLGVRTLRRLEEHAEATGRRIRDGGPSFNILSDAGVAFDMRVSNTFSGILRTAFRAVDIMSERVGSLEYEVLHSSSRMLKHPLVVVGLRSAVSTTSFDDVPAEPLQTALKNIRTDLDRFSDIEVQWLVRQGYAATREKVERAAAARSIDVEAATLEGGRKTPWDPIVGTGAAAEAARTPKRRPRPDPDDRTTLYKTLHRGGHRRFRLFAMRDLVSWVNVAVVVLVALGIFVSSRSVVTQAKFFSEAYPLSHTVTVKYSPDVAERWLKASVPPTKQPLVREYLKGHQGFGPNSRGYQHLLAYAKDDALAGGRPWPPPPTVEHMWRNVFSELEDKPQRLNELDATLKELTDAEVERQYLHDLARAWHTLWLASRWQGVQGLEGVGRAFTKVIGKQEPPPQRWTGIRRAVSSVIGGIWPSNVSLLKELRRDPESRLKGILYYTFPQRGRGWLTFLPVVPFVGRDDKIVLDFDGRLIKKSGGYDLCLSFVQRPGALERQDIQLVFDDRDTGYTADLLGGYTDAKLDRVTWVRDQQSMSGLCGCFVEGNGAASPKGSSLEKFCQVGSPVKAFAIGSMTIALQ